MARRFCLATNTSTNTCSVSSPCSAALPAVTPAVFSAPICAIATASRSCGRTTRHRQHPYRRRTRERDHQSNIDYEDTAMLMKVKGEKSLIVGLDIGTSKIVAIVGEYA